jgi:hypothetical protein
MPRRKHRRVTVTRKYTRRMAPRPAGLAGMTGAVGSLQDYRAELAAQRGALDVQIQAVDSALAVMGAPVAARRAKAGRRGPGRPPGRATAAGKTFRPGSLKACLANVLSGGGIMAVKDITAGVLKSGYKSKNKTLAKSVGIALTEMKGVAKVGRGRFRLK